MALPDPHYQDEFYSNVAFKRLIAWIIDTLIILIICVLIVIATASIAAFFFLFLLAAVGFAYRVITLANRSATLGMRMMAIELRNSSGHRLETGEALLHTIGFTLSWMVPVIQFLSMILMASSPRGQGVTDYVLGTTALNCKADAFR